MKPKATPLATAVNTAASTERDGYRSLTTAVAASTGGSPARLLPLVPAAASALFALQHSAEAAILYSGPQNATVSLPGAFGSDHTNFGFGPESFNFSVLRHNNPPIIGAAFVLSGPSFLLNGSGGLKKLAAGAVISAPQFPGHAGTAGSLRAFSNGNPIKGTWASAQTGFAAFQAGNGDLGWLRMEWTNTDGNPDPNTLTIVDTAYNDVPGQSIQAGQTSSAPEPSSAALLALAVSGAAALRRRRMK